MLQTILMVSSSDARRIHRKFTLEREDPLLKVVTMRFWSYRHMADSSLEKWLGE